MYLQLSLTNTLYFERVSGNMVFVVWADEYLQF